ncbi:MAG TPA: hypothetical protein VHQ64_14925, partial [Pyrinomonadaceae bacterium]|nr:hypothetical protein [Pyrinomonadaceae bacterium]
GAEAPQRKARIHNALIGAMALGFGTVFFRKAVAIVGIFFSLGCFLYLLLIDFAEGGESSSASAATTERKTARRRGKVFRLVKKVASAVAHVAGVFWKAVVALWIGLLLLGVSSLLSDMAPSLSSTPPRN